MDSDQGHGLERRGAESEWTPIPSAQLYHTTLPPYQIRLETPCEGRNTQVMSRTYRTSRRTFSRVTDSRTPRTPGARGYQVFGDGSFRFEHPLDRVQVKRSVSKARRRGAKQVIRAEVEWYG